MGEVGMNFEKIFNDFPIVESENLILREIRVDDAADLFNYYSNEAVYRYLDWYGPESIEKAEEIIKIWRQGYDEGWIIRFAIVSKKTNKIIGTVFLSEFYEGVRGEIGYELSEAYWRQGIMTEVLNNILPLAFDKIGLIRIQAFVNTLNIASKTLLKKVGFKEEGSLRKFEYHSIEKVCNDMSIFALLNNDYNNKQ